MVEVSCFNHKMHNGSIMGAYPLHYYVSCQSSDGNVETFFCHKTKISLHHSRPMVTYVHEQNQI